MQWTWELQSGSNRLMKRLYSGGERWKPLDSLHGGAVETAIYVRRENGGNRYRPWDGGAVETALYAGRESGGNRYRPWVGDPWGAIEIALARRGLRAVANATLGWKRSLSLQWMGPVGIPPRNGQN